MTSMLKYAWLTIRHKVFVFRAGLKLGVPMWLLVIHDIDKFYPDELPHYGRQFFGDKNDPEGFIRCWTRHQNRNPHHWEYWIPRTGHNRCSPPFPDNISIPMPREYVLEMVADWCGASRAYEGRWPWEGKWEWADKNVDSILQRVHFKTGCEITKALASLDAKEKSE